MARFCNNIGAAATLLLPLFITFFITTTVPTAESVSTAAAANTHNSNSSQKCGGATECGTVAGGGEEFLMGSQTATYWLPNSLQGTTQNIIYGSLQTGAICDARRAGSCLAQAVNPNLNACKNIRNRSCFKK